MRRTGPISLALLLCACSAADGLEPPAGDSSLVAGDGLGGDAAAGDHGPPCAANAAAGAPFGGAVPISDPAAASFVPAMAARGDRVLLAWHTFISGAPVIQYTVIVAGCVRPTRTLVEAAARALRPSVASTADGFVIGYHVEDAMTMTVRAAWLDGDGNLLAGPETISGAGALGTYVQLASDGTNVAFAWTDGPAHYFALRGPRENVVATAVGSTLQSTVIVNNPRIALADDGTLYLAFRDGGSMSADWDALLWRRPVGGPFAFAANLSNSPGLLSDDLDLTMLSGTTVEITWIEQDPINVNSFEVTYATRNPAGAVTAPTRYATQGLWSWTPSNAAGLAAVWNTGAGGVGQLYFADGPTAPVQIFAGVPAHFPELARDDIGALHLAFIDRTAAGTINYARGP